MKINCRTGAANTPARAPIAKEREKQGHPGAQRDAQDEGGRADDREAAGEGEHAPAAAQPGEDGPGVPDHGRRDGRVHQGHRHRAPAAQDPCPTYPVRQHQAEQPGRGALQRVPGQHRDGAGPPSWSFMFQKPGFWSPTWRGSNPARPAGQHRDRNRAQEVAAGHGSHPGVNHDRLFSPHPIPAGARPARVQPDGVRPAGPGPDRRAAVLADARHRAGQRDEPERRPAPLGDVRRVAGRRGPGPLPGPSRPSRRMAVRRAGNLVGPARLRGRARPVGRPRPLRRA